METKMNKNTVNLEAPKEYVEQAALVSWLAIHPKLKKYFLKNDNEGKRTPAQGNQAKRLGLRRGVSDLFICYPTTAYHGLWLEIKRNKKYTPSEQSTETWKAQENFIEDMKSIGYAGFFCYGWIDGKNIIESYLLS